MSYTPTTWTTGDTITASAMNKIENGIANAGGAMIVNLDDGELDKTYTEIYGAISSGTPVYLRYSYGDSESPNEGQRLAPITAVYRYSDSVYRVAVNQPHYANMIQGISGKADLFTPSIAIFATSSASGYPTFYACITTNNSAVTDYNIW